MSRLARLLTASASSLALSFAPAMAGSVDPIARGLAASAAASTPQPGTGANNYAVGNDSRINFSTFYAPSFGSCTWDAAHDVGPCIMLANAAAVAAGGGTVEIPAGSFGLATALTKSARAVHWHGMGVGDVRDTVSPNSFRSATRLVWIGASGATMFDEEPVSTSSESLYASDVDGIVFDCASLANICAKIAQTSHSKIKIGVAEPRLIGAYLTTTSTSDSPGSQDNDVWIDARCTDGNYSPTCILLDGGQGSNWNVSYNRFWRLHAWFNKGDGVVIASSDNNLIFDLSTYPQPGATGTPSIFASPGYVMPNGLATSSLTAYTTRVLHIGSPVTVQGYTQGSTLSASVGNTGTATTPPVVLATNATTTVGSQTLTFASTASLAAGMDIRCGSGPNSGVVNDDTAFSVSAGTVQLGYPTTAAVASGTSCTFSYGVNATAVTGTYTITATSPSTFNVTAPSGGTSQTGLTLTNGALVATDFTIPFSGTPATGDAWTLVVRAAPTNIILEAIDKANSIPNPHFGPGATGGYVPSAGLYPVQSSYRGGINIYFGPEGCNGKTPSVGPLAVNIGGCGSPGASGTYAANVGGVGNNASGFGSTSLGGNNIKVSGTYAYGRGQSTTATGYGSDVAGQFATDRGAYGKQVYGSGKLAADGDAQFGALVLRGTGAGTAAIRLTQDGATAGAANVVNVPSAAAFSLEFQLVALDITTPSNSFSAKWTASHVLSRAGAASTTLFDNVTTAIAPDSTKVAGAVTPTASATADTTNGGLNVSFTPPAGNTDTWHVVACFGGGTCEVQ